MAFQPSAYKSAQPKPLPVILLLDGSGSMSVSGKILVPSVTADITTR